MLFSCSNQSRKMKSITLETYPIGKQYNVYSTSNSNERSFYQHIETDNPCNMIQNIASLFTTWSETEYLLTNRLDSRPMVANKDFFGWRVGDRRSVGLFVDLINDKWQMLCGYQYFTFRWRFQCFLTNDLLLRSCCIPHFTISNNISIKTLPTLNTSHSVTSHAYAIEYPAA